MSSALEIGHLFVGTTELKFHNDGSSYEGWSYGKPNNVGGIGVKHEIYNASDKAMKYLTCVYLPYNQVVDVVSSTTTGESEARCKLTGPFSPNEKSEVQWEVLWYNSTVTKVKIKEVIIQYMDDTEETISGDDLKDISNKESVYYETRGKQEEADRAENSRKSALRKAYICFMVFTCLKKAKEDEETKFHANQGLLLFIMEVIAIIIGNVPHVGGFISLALWVIAIVFSIKGIVDINNNRQNEIPLIGKIKILK